MSVQAALDFIRACRAGRVRLDDLSALDANPRAAICRRGAETGYDFDGDALERALGVDAHMRVLAASRRQG